jgi:prepilin-type N-terminal cleavage/methylation domain-containing protein
MSIFSRAQRRGMTLVEVLIASSLSAVVMTLLLQAMVDVHRFYQRVSTQSRQVGSALLFLDRVEGMSFGLPRQAFTLTTSPSGGAMLVIQPLSTLAASGMAVYSTSRWVLENSSRGVVLWTIQGEAQALGAPLSQFPPDSPARSSLLLGPGWQFQAEFSGGNFPLRLTVLPPDGGIPYRRAVEGYH